MLPQYENNKINNLRRYLGLRLALILSVFMALLLISYIFSSTIITARKNDNVLLNVSGQQRMLIYQYASEISQALVGLGSHDLKMALYKKKQADSTAEKFEDVLEALKNGGAVSVSDGADTVSAIKDDEILKHLAHVNEQWGELKRIALLSLRAESIEVASSPYVQQLLEQASATVVEMNHIVEMIKNKSDSDLRRLDILLLLMIISGLVLFGIVMYFVFYKIIQPLDYSVSALNAAMKNVEGEKLRAEQESHYKSEFLSRMSHELRTPMNAILGFAQVLEMSQKLTENQRDNVKEILLAGYHLLDLINEVLDLAKVESGKMDIKIEDVNISDLVRKCVNVIMPQAKQCQIEIINNMNDDYIIRADKTRLKQVLLNLLSNAVKYNCVQGRIYLDVESADDGRIRLAVTDSGGGLTEDEISRIFTPFERLNTDNSIQGTGIGLAITRQLVELMDGVIGVESLPGEGSTFWVEFKQSAGI